MSHLETLYRQYALRLPTAIAKLIADSKKANYPDNTH